MSKGFEDVIDRARARWHVFGEYPGEGAVDIADSDRDVLTRIPRDLAEQIVEAHNRAIDRIVALVES